MGRTGETLLEKYVQKRINRRRAGLDHPLFRMITIHVEDEDDNGAEVIYHSGMGSPSFWPHTTPLLVVLA